MKIFPHRNFDTHIADEETGVCSISCTLPFVQAYTLLPQGTSGLDSGVRVSFLLPTAAQGENTSFDEEKMMCAYNSVYFICYLLINRLLCG